ncbi:MAG: hypothetical protein ACXW1D_00355 [Halobacteriota archaeon]
MKTNFSILANGTTNNKTQFIAVDESGALLATITPRFNAASSKYSDRFLNVCFMDGSCEIADRQDGEFDTEHASEVIAKKLFN